MEGFLFLLVTGWVSSFVAGLLGVGGAIVLFPVLVTVPGWLGFPPLAVQSVSGVVLVQVFLAMSLATRQHARAGAINWSRVRPLALSAAGFAWIGGLGSRMAPDRLLLATFAGLTLLSAVAIAWPMRSNARPNTDDSPTVRKIARIAAALVGFLSGLTGLGGAILLAPVLRWTSRLSAHELVATTPPIVAATAFSGLLGKLAGGPLDWGLALCLAFGTLFGAPVGARFGRRLSPGLLRALLAIAIGLSALQVSWRAWHAG